MPPRPNTTQLAPGSTLAVLVTAPTPVVTPQPTSQAALKGASARILATAISGKTVKLTVPLETAPDTNRDEIVLTARSPFQGAKVANISPAVADELRLDASTEGVVVIDLADGGTAASVGFQKGDIILAVNNQKIAKTSDLDKASKIASRIWRITVVRGGQQINVTLGG